MTRAARSRWIQRSTRLAALASALVLFPASAFASSEHRSGDSDGSFHLHIDGDDGGKVDVELSLGWLAAFVDWSDFECDVDTDSDTRRMARALDRAGEGSVYEFEDEDGEQVAARRVDGLLKLESRNDNGKTARVAMPWPLAECLFLGREPHGGMGRALSRGDFKIKVEGRDGGRVTIDSD